MSNGRIHTGPGGSIDIENLFTYHPPKPDQIERYEKIREAGKAFAELLDEAVPGSPERSTALAKIREAVMWANAAIACNEK
jgi:hypothetical protein